MKWMSAKDSFFEMYFSNAWGSQVGWMGENFRGYVLAEQFSCCKQNTYKTWNYRNVITSAKKRLHLRNFSLRCATDATAGLFTVSVAFSRYLFSSHPFHMNYKTAHTWYRVNSNILCLFHTESSQILMYWNSFSSMHNKCYSGKYRLPVMNFPRECFFV
jgi:hypothetical protein